jgi:hypothetical protein
MGADGIGEGSRATDSDLARHVAARTLSTRGALVVATLKFSRAAGLRHNGTDLTAPGFVAAKWTAYTSGSVSRVTNFPLGYCAVD